MPLVIIIIVLYLFMRIDSNKTNKKVNEEKQKFWNKEYKSNEIRKKDISSLAFIKIPIDELPIKDTTDETLLALQHSIINLSKVSILNLTGISNTDLKLQYGVANLTFLSECDNNYTLLVNSLYKWGSYLYDIGLIDDAKIVLEFGITCNTDISRNYILLANIYKEQNTPNKIDNLLDTISNLNTISKESILNSVKEIKNSTYLV
jgi:hypothetical protein